jgi:hypothetical protein
MSYKELLSKHKVQSELSELTRDELEIYHAFVELAETDADVKILGRAWLREHARKNR